MSFTGWTVKNVPKIHFTITPTDVKHLNKYSYIRKVNYFRVQRCMAFDVFFKAIGMGSDLLKSVIFKLYENRRQMDANLQQSKILVLQCYVSIHVGGFYKLVAR